MNKDFEDMYKGIVEKCQRQDRINNFKEIWNILQEMCEGGFTMEYAMLFMAIMAKFNGTNDEDTD